MIMAADATKEIRFAIGHVEILIAPLPLYRNYSQYRISPH
jgi:hypothetical protein